MTETSSWLSSLSTNKSTISAEIEVLALGSTFLPPTSWSFDPRQHAYLFERSSARELAFVFSAPFPFLFGFVFSGIFDVVFVLVCLYFDMF